MKLGSVVWFADHSRPFLVKERFCADPDCACNEVHLTLQEISESGEKVPQPLSLHLRVDLATLQERDPPARSARLEEWARQFMATYPAEWEAELKARYEVTKRTARRIAKYRVDPLDVLEGWMISFADVLNDEGALSSGGRGYTHLLLYEGREYLVEDRYCSNPECECEEIHLEFWKCGHREPGERKVTVSPGMLAKVTLSGRREVVEPGDCPPGLAEEILSAWWDCYRHDLPILVDRYRQAKEIGRRSLDAAETAVPEPHGMLAESRWTDDVLSEEPRAAGGRVGRNDPCPCGSGKKYKKCCERVEKSAL